MYFWNLLFKQEEILAYFVFKIFQHYIFLEYFLSNFIMSLKILYYF